MNRIWATTVPTQRPFTDQHGTTPADRSGYDTRDVASTKGAQLASFTDRIIGTAGLDPRAYEEVEADATATRQAMGVVLLSSLAGGIGTLGLGAGGLGGVIVGGIGVLVAWVAWAFLTYVIGTRLLPEPQTRSDLKEMMRVLGFAQSAGLARIFGIIPGVGPLVLGIASIWMLVAMVIAVRQALDYTSTWRALGVCIVGWVVAGVITVLFVGSGSAVG